MAKPKKRLDQYKGRLNASQVAEGMNAAINNAKRLAVAASLLFEKEDYALAASIAALSIEESGKCSILRSLSIARNDEDLIQCWREYRSHTKKNIMWILPQLFASGSRRLQDFAPMFDKDSEHPFLLDHIKQLGFYTDCLGKANWSIPANVIDKDLSKSLIKIANLLSKSEQISEAEILLWIKHVGPVWKGSLELMEHAVVNWYSEMQENGLAKKGSNAMENFILNGIGQIQNLNQ